MTLAAAAPAALADPLPPNCTGTTTVTCTFDYNGTTGGDGSPQLWTVPPGASSVYFDVLGAQGGNEYSLGSQVGWGGLGGETTGTLALEPGTTVAVLVGSGGDGVPAEGGYNGGGRAGTFGRAGGGASDVRVGGTGLGNRILIAGGGGGSGNLSSPPDRPFGGAGGGATGGVGHSSPVYGEGGEGGTQNAGGIGSDGGGSGVSGLGGAGADDGGGGGGGYFGGAGGGERDDVSMGNIEGAGGGGSGFFIPDPTRVTGGTTFAGMREGNGHVTLTYTTAPVTATTTTVTSSKNPSTEGQSVTFTATVGPNDGSGTVAFSTGSSTLGGCGAVALTNTNGSWQASCTSFSDAAAGNYPITATYSGSALYGPSSGSLAGGQQVNKPSTAKPAMRIADASGPEGNSGTHLLSFRVTLSRSSSSPVTAQWSTANGTAKAPSDFAAKSGTVTFSPGQTSRTLTVAVKGDRTKEPNEVFYVLMRNPTQATLADPNASGGIFTDD